MRKIGLLIVAISVLLPVMAIAQNNQGGSSQGGRGGAPLPIVGAGLPGLALVGAVYLIRRKQKSTDD